MYKLWVSRANGDFKRKVCRRGRPKSPSCHTDPLSAFRRLYLCWEATIVVVDVMSCYITCCNGVYAVKSVLHVLCWYVVCITCATLVWCLHYMCCVCVMSALHELCWCDVSIACAVLVWGLHHMCCVGVMFCMHDSVLQAVHVFLHAWQHVYMNYHRSLGKNY